ncbi:MAG: DMT family transporter [candidate division WOR-3 bacterium]|jgi:drug/metabolite transporter (DMT)-like permease
MNRDNTKGFLYALGGTLLVSTNYITAKYGLKGFNPETFSLVWTLAASFYALIAVIVSGRVRELAIPKKKVRSILLLGLATGSGMVLAWSGLSLLDPSFASFLWRFSPVLIIILSVFILGERLRLIEAVPIGIMVLGGAMTTYGRWHIVGTGVILTLLGCVAVAVQMLVVKLNVKEIHPNVLVFYRVSLAALFIALWSAMAGKLNFEISAPHLAVTLLGAFLGPCASFLLTFRSYRYWELSRSSIVLTAQPLFVLPMAALVFGTIPTGLELAGGFVILGGAFFLVLLHRAQIIQ